jgi:hypothetical protein
VSQRVGYRFFSPPSPRDTSVLWQKSKCRMVFGRLEVLLLQVIRFIAAQAQVDDVLDLVASGQLQGFGPV